MKVYYAHCLALYHTPQEARDMETLHALFPNAEILNPNNPGIDSFCHAVKETARIEGDDPSQRVMDHVFKPIVQSQDALAFRALPGGLIPAGVLREIAWAQEKNIPVLELPGYVLRRGLSVDDTREYLREVGQR